MNKRTIGKRYEAEVTQYLERKKYRIIKTNYYFKHQEIDLIALDGEVLVFVEVKYRSCKLDQNHYNPFTSVDFKKQQSMITVARHFIEQHPDFQNCFARYDVVFVLSHRTATHSNPKNEMVHFENAFSEL